MSLNNLGVLLQAMGDLSGARPYYERALAIQEKVLGPEHPDTARSLNNLANLLQAMGDLRGARPYAERALAIREKVLGPEHPDTAMSLNNLGYLLSAMGDLRGARPYYERALAIWEKVLGLEHPNTAMSLNNLGVLLQAMGDTDGALTLYRRARASEETALAAMLAVGTEGQKQLYMDTLEGSTDATVSFHLRGAPKNAGALTLALETVLRRKGRVLEASADQSQSLRASLSPGDRPLLDELADAQRRYASLVLRPPESLDPAQLRSQLDASRADMSRVEEALSKRSAAFAVATRPVTLEAVREALPARSALVELVIYVPLDPKAPKGSRWGEARYAAYIMRPEGDPGGVDLGPAAPIDVAAKALREAIAGRSADVKARARELDALVMAKVRPLLGDASTLLISPDGELALVPFEALVGEDGRWLVERYSVSYLSSGRDLVRWRVPAPPTSPPLLMADVDFDVSDPHGRVDVRAAGAPSAQSVATRSSDQTLATARWPPLPDTGAEADALSAVGLFRGAAVLRGALATEAAVKAVAGPRILHIATHGFFLDDLPRAAPPDSGRDLTGQRARAPSAESPLLRSGVVLAGANQHPGADAGDDGLLTALEASTLDLRGTQLVVLSACETGLGATGRGVGVAGLQRALVLAGARTQVMSLWKVDDRATQELMVAYYQRLEAGEGRAEAMRQVRLAFLRGDAATATAGALRSASPLAGAPATTVARWSHPYY